VYDNASWNRPFVSVFADVSSIVALSVDGGVLECRPGSRDSSLAPQRQR
jgi:hypothetical protein